MNVTFDNREELISPGLRLNGDVFSASQVRNAVIPASIIVFLSMLPVTMLVPVLKEIVGTRFAADSFWTHSFMWVNMAGAILAAPVMASLSDRLPERRTTLAVALALDALLIASITLADSLVTMLVLRFFEGAAHIVVISTLMAYGADWAGETSRGRVMGLLGAAMMFGTTIGAPLGGVWGNKHPLAALQLGAIFALLAAVGTLIFLKRVPMRPRAKNWQAIRGLLRERHDLLFPYIYAFIDRLCVGVIVSTFVLFLAERHGLTPAQRGGLLSLFLFPFAILCYPAGRLTDRIGRVWCMCLGSIGFGIVYAFYGAVSLESLRVLMVLSGVLSAIMFAPNLAICADLAPADRRATAYAGFNMAGSLGFVCGPLLGGLLCGPLNGLMGVSNPYAIVFPLVGSLEVLCALLTLPWVIRYARNRRQSAAPTIGV